MCVREICLVGVLLAAVPGCAAAAAPASVRSDMPLGGSPRAAGHQAAPGAHSWRLPGPYPAAAVRREERALPDDRRRRLDRALARYLATRPGRAAVAVFDRTTFTRYAFRDDREPYLLASVAKVDILLALLLRAQREGRRLDRHERALAARMIRRSDNDCARELYLAIGGRRGLAETLHTLGARHTRPGPARHWGDTRSRPSDQVLVLERLTARDGPVSAAGRRYALGLMSTVVPSQAWGVGAVGERAAVKNGWLPVEEHDGLWTINSVGRLTVGGHELLMAVLSERSPAMSTGVTTVEQITRLTVAAFAGQDA